ncbi:hypothetical protein AALO_G00278030 [Alosa alosa]|uniref:Uncharacterized protein n=1 Tax=Alosa alosa TaxID=278164 RepID=A0AAV6FM20_9TELE|nr:hypothetical protein AALO_G00278030 [Alosa alosa]
MSSVIQRGMSWRKVPMWLMLPNPNNQTQTGANDGASEDYCMLSPQNQTTAAQTENAVPSATGGVTVESKDGPSEDAEVITPIPNAQNQTTSAHSIGTDGASEDAVLTTVLNLQDGTTNTGIDILPVV